MSEANGGVRTFVSRETQEHKELAWSDCQDASLQRDASSEVKLGFFLFKLLVYRKGVGVYVWLRYTLLCV